MTMQAKKSPRAPGEGDDTTGRGPLRRFAGNPQQMGFEHGKVLSGHIARNLRDLVRREDAVPLGKPDFAKWVKDQERLISRSWPWLLEEMNGIAQGSGQSYEDILLLNLRSWQYKFYGAATPLNACSSLAITLADGTVASAGTLDDGSGYYGGPMAFVPEKGHALITCPIVGTCWVVRALNSRGLAIGTSSQILPGLHWLENTVNQDLALRAMTQTCETVEEVRAFCREFPFAANIVAVDRKGGIFCAHQTAAGLLEYPLTEGWCALTNHIADDAFLYWTAQRGVKEQRVSDSTRPRRGNLMKFAQARNARCDGREVRDFIRARDDSDLGSIHNTSTCYLTFANPQVARNTFWIMQKGEDDFSPYQVS